MTKHTKASSLMDTIRDAVRASGLSSYALMRASGVNSAVICRFMVGQRDMNLETANRLCEALGLELRPVRRAKGAR